jgi:signal peptidase I
VSLRVRQLARRFLLPEFNRRYLARLAAVSLFCWLFFGWICRPCFLDGGSMLPTYPARGIVFCWRPGVWFGTPARGTVVVLRFVGHRVYLLKRIVAVAGDTVEFREGCLFVNGEPERPFRKTQGECRWNLSPRRVDAGCVYVIGDNRSMPMDEHLFGQVGIARLEGIPFRISEVLSMKRLLIALIAVLVAGAVWFFFFRETPEQRIRRRFTKLLKTVEKEEKETNSAKAAKLFALQGLFGNAIDLQIAELPMNGSYTNEEICAEVMRGRLYCATIRLALNDMETVLTTKEKADARVSVTAEVRAPGGNLWKERREIRVQAELQNKNWRFTSFLDDALLQK